MIHPVTNALIFLGRADGVLNPSGVRFGSAEIYKIIEAEFPQVLDSLCVGQRRQQDSDEAIVLFLLMKPGVPFNQALKNKVRLAIREGLSPRHVPKYVLQTPTIPVSTALPFITRIILLNRRQTTVNLKKVELVVKQIISGQKVKPSGALLNPESLDYYYQFVNIESWAESRSVL